MTHANLTSMELHEMFKRASKHAMVEKDMKNSQLADSLGISRQSITSLFKHNTPKIDKGLQPMLNDLGFVLEVVPKDSNGEITYRFSDENIPNSSRMIPKLWLKIFDLLGLELVLKKNLLDNA